MYTHRFETRYAGIALSVLLSTALSLPAHAAEIWKVDLAKSTFSSGANRLVLERVSGKATPGMELKGTPATGTFLVISDGKIYLAADESASDATSSTCPPTVTVRLFPLKASFCSFAPSNGTFDTTVTPIPGTYR